MKKFKLHLFCAVLLLIDSAFLHAVCTPNPCSLPVGPTRCSPVDLPNTCDTQNWCVTRSNIVITPTKDPAYECAYFVKVTITYQLCIVGSPTVLPYQYVALWMTRRPPGCVDSPADLGTYPVPHYMCNDIIGGPWILKEVQNTTSPSCTVQNTRTFTTVVGFPSNCNNPPVFSLNGVTCYPGWCDNYEFFWEVDLVNQLTPNPPYVLDITGRNRIPLDVCYPSPSSSSSESESSSSESSSSSDSSSSSSSESSSSESSSSSSPSESPSESPSPSEEPHHTETIIRFPCQGGIEPMGSASDVGREAGSFGAGHDLRPVGDAFLVTNPSGQAGGGGTNGCPFVFSFGGGISQGSPTQREFNMQLPAGTVEPLLYYQYGPNNWRPVPDQERDSNGTLRVTPELSGYFQVFSKITNPKPNVGEVYVFPNPSKNGDVPTVHIDADKSDEVFIRIYDVSGDLVTETFVTSGIKTENGKPCYEHALNPNLFKSGVYVGAVTLKRNGQTGRKTFRFTVTK